MSDEYRLRTQEIEHEYVDIHGRDIPPVIIEETGEVAFPLSELKQTGVAIFQKSQYAKLATIDKKFDDDFHVFMLESAKDYMLKNKISFSEDQIVKSINNCKRVLTENKRIAQPCTVFKNRQIEEKPDNGILIKVLNEPSASKFTQGSIPKQKFNFNKNKSPKSRKEFSQDALKQKQNNKKRPLNENNQETKSNKKENESVPKLRSPKSKILERFALNEQKQVNHHVIVTCVEKRNCIWVRDEANNDIFNTIFKMTNEEAKFQAAPRKPLQFEKVYLAKNGDSWFRCKIMGFAPLVVFFLDYGNVAKVDELKQVSEELAKIPCMSVRLTFQENIYVPSLENKLKIRILKQNEDGTYFVNILEQRGEDSPTEFQSTNADKTKEPKGKTKTLKFSKMPPPLCTLENDQKVVIIHEENGILYLRTKQCFEQLREIEKECEKQWKSAESIQNVEVNQLILVRNEDGKFYRAVVKKTNQNGIDLEFLDYFRKVTVKPDALKNISESLSLKPITYFRGGKPNNFENMDSSEEAKNLILKSMLNRKKFAVVLDDNAVFDLFDGSQLLSEQLQALEDGDEKVRLRDIKRFEPEIGLKTYLCGCFKDINDFTLVPSDELTKYVDSVLMQTVEDTESYSPVVGEVCFCFYVDNWYRCVVTRTLSKEFEVLLLDFGNVELIKGSDLRKPGREIAEIPALALPCRLVDIPDHPEAHELLKKKIIDGELYKVRVKGVNGGKCEVEIPSVYQQIRKTPVKKF